MRTLLVLVSLGVILSSRPYDEQREEILWQRRIEERKLALSEKAVEADKVARIKSSENYAMASNLKVEVTR